MTLPELQRGGKERRKSWRSLANLQMALGPSHGTDRTPGSSSTDSRAAGRGTLGRAGSFKRAVPGLGSRGWSGASREASAVVKRGRGRAAGVRHAGKPEARSGVYIGLQRLGLRAGFQIALYLGAWGPEECEIEGIWGGAGWGHLWGKLQAESSVQNKALEIVILSASHLIPATVP